MPASAGFPFFAGMPPQAPGPFRGMAPMAARRARPVQRSRFQGLQGNLDACHPRRSSACHDNNGAPAEAQRSGFGGERRHSGGNELCRLRRSERSVTCADEAGGDARPVSALSVQPTAAMSPRIGGRRGELPRPFLSHRFLLERKRCPGRAGPPREGHPGVGTRELLIRLAFGHPPSPQRGEGFGRMISAPAGPAIIPRTDILTDISKTGCRRRRASSVMSG